jgi:dihydroflavonol-4-reductase
MRVVITGGAGFIGRAVVERLAARGDDVVALVRDPARAGYLKRDHVSLVISDLKSVPQMTAQMSGADAVIHAAGQYRIGIKPSERDAMWDANVGTTERVLDAAVAAAASRIVYVSTVNTYGNTNGAEPDETFRRDEKLGFVSWYDETKYRAHQAAEKRIADGAPILIVMPTQVYGPNDHSQASEQIEMAYRGTLRFVALTSLGLSWVHVHDLADGIIAALDRGRIGEAYALAGERHTLGDSIAIAARLGGHKPPRLSIPTGVLRLMAPLNDRIGGLPGLPANARETIAASDGVTYYASHAKAAAELGFKPRGLEQGIIDTWGPGASSASQAKRA